MYDNAEVENMPLFDVQIALEASGSVQIEAADEAAARRLARGLDPTVDWGFPPEGVDTTDFDNCLDKRIEGCSPAEPEESASAAQ
jgi:hypothetical protein